MNPKIVMKLADQVADLLNRIADAKNAPEAARKALATAVIGHQNWGGRDVQPIRGASLHRAALDAVTDKLVTDLAEQKRAELAAMAVELDELRHKLANQAEALRFALLDEVRAAREWRYEPATEEARP